MHLSPILQGTLESQETSGKDISLDNHSCLSDTSKALTKFNNTQYDASESYTNFNYLTIISNPPRHTGQAGQKNE